jgi:hypothetical protein
MKRVTWAAAAMAVLIPFGMSQAPRAQTGDTVHLDVVVSEKESNKPIADLKQEELQIEDDGKKVEVKGFTPVKQTSGRTIVLLLDDTAVARATQSIQTLAGFILRTAAPGDKIAVVRFHIADDLKLAFSVEAVGSRLGAFTAGTIPYAQLTTPDELLDTVTKISTGLNEPANQRKAIVCIGAPAVCALAARSKNDEGRKWQFWTTAMNALAKTNTTVYSFMPVATASFDGTVVDYTGGTAFTNAADFTPFAERVWAELGTHYIVEYVGQPGQKDVRGVSVKTTRKNAVVHARKQR